MLLLLNFLRCVYIILTGEINFFLTKTNILNHVSPVVALQLSVTVDVPDEEAYILQPRLFGKVMHNICVINFH